MRARIFEEKNGKISNTNHLDLIILAVAQLQVTAISAELLLNGPRAIVVIKINNRLVQLDFRVRAKTLCKQPKQSKQYEPTIPIASTFQILNNVNNVNNVNYLNNPNSPSINSPPTLIYAFYRFKIYGAQIH
jgi:hypothetical protein